MSNTITNTKKITYTGLMIALVFVTTAIVPQIPIPFTEGYIHTGDSMIFVAAILLGWKYGALAGGLGSALADLYLGYTHWILPTLIIKAIMGAIVGLMAKEYKNRKLTTVKNLFSVLIGLGWVFIGVSLRSILTTKIGNLGQSDLANFLVTEFELESINSLLDLVNSVQTSILVSMILVPILILIAVVVLNKKDKQLFSLSNLMGMLVSGLWMVIGYYFAGGILKGNMIVPIFSVPANILQFIGGAVIAFPIVIGLKRTKYLDNLDKKL